MQPLARGPELQAHYETAPTRRCARPSPDRRGVARGAGDRREDRPGSRPAAGGRARDGARSARGRRRLLRGGHGRRCAGERGVEIATCAARWTSAAPPDAWCARSAPRIPEIAGTDATRTRPRSRGLSEKLPGIEFFVNDERPAAAARRRLARSRLRDLDLVALRACARPALVRGDAPRDAARRAPGVHHARADLGGATTRRSSCARPSSRGRSPTRSTARAGGTRRSSARRATGASINPDWGTAFLSPEWMLAQLCPHWRVLEFAPGRNQENQDVYVLERV